MTDKITSILKNSECLYSFSEINQALDQMASDITKTLEHERPIILSVMTGGIIPTGHLVTRLHFPLEIDYIHATRYTGAMVGGELKWIVKPRLDLTNRTVLIIDDIMDGGITLQGIIQYCHTAKAKQVLSAVMVNKNRPREKGVQFEPDYIGLHTPDRFLFGFGLDYEEYLRNVPGIYALKEDVSIP